MVTADLRDIPAMPYPSAMERLAAGEAVHPDDLTDEELLLLLPNMVPVLQALNNKQTESEQHPDPAL